MNIRFVTWSGMHDLITTTKKLTKYCTEQRAMWRKAEHVAMKQLPSVILSIVVIFNILVTSSDIISTEVIVDNTSLSDTSFSRLTDNVNI